MDLISLTDICWAGVFSTCPTCRASPPLVLTCQLHHTYSTLRYLKPDLSCRVTRHRPAASFTFFFFFFYRHVSENHPCQHSFPPATVLYNSSSQSDIGPNGMRPHFNKIHLPSKYKLASFWNQHISRDTTFNLKVNTVCPVCIAPFLICSGSSWRVFADKSWRLLGLLN